MVILNGTVMLIAGILIWEATSVSAAPHISNNPQYYNSALYNEQVQNPEYILQALTRLRQALLSEEDLDTAKRGVDLGMGRGDSALQTAKHLWAMKMANSAFSPGRRRRSAVAPNQQLDGADDSV